MYIQKNVEHTFVHAPEIGQTKKKKQQNFETPHLEKRKGHLLKLIPTLGHQDCDLGIFLRDILYYTQENIYAAIH